MTDLELSSYIYWEYSIAVMVATEVFRMFLKKNPAKFFQLIAVKQAKWLTLIVATVLALLDWLIFSKGRVFHLWQFIISFGFAVLGYDYVLKLFKDQFKKIANRKKSPTHHKYIEPDKP